jgi:hypothetical protein
MKLADITTEDVTTLVGLLTEEQKNELVGQMYSADSYFNPIQDFYDNWIISVEEIMYCTNKEFFWIKDLELITYKPKPTPSPF